MFLGVQPPNAPAMPTILAEFAIANESLWAGGGYIAQRNHGEDIYFERPKLNKLHPESSFKCQLKTH